MGNTKEELCLSIGPGGQEIKLTAKRKKQIDAEYNRLNSSALELYEFVMRYNKYIYQARDYGNGDEIRMVEVHTLAMIEDNPGISVSELAKRWKRTKGTVSVNIGALEKRGYIRREKDPENARVARLYPTQKGRELSTMHKMYDNREIVETRKRLREGCTQEELDAFYKAVHLYLDLLNEL